MVDFVLTNLFHGVQKGIDMYSLRLPRLVGTRQAALKLVTDAGLPDLHGETVAVLCRDLSYASISSTNALVEELVGERGARQIILVGAPDEFVELVRGAASDLNYAEEVVTIGAAETVGV